MGFAHTGGMTQLPAPSAATPILVACLCAGWCSTCEAYRGAFTQTARELPGTRFLWVDIEDESDALGDAALDIENFPTLLILRGGEPCFYGTVLPHAGTLLRLAEAAGEEGELPTLSAAVASSADAWALAAAVSRLSDELPFE